MEPSYKSRLEYFLFAILWGAPGLLTLMEAYRLAHLPRLHEVNLFEGPVGYMLGIGSLLLGFSIWEIILGLRHKTIKLPPKSKQVAILSKKIYLSILFMILFLILVPILGFVLASGFFLALTLRLLGCKAKVIIITILFYCGGLYWLVPLLGLSLPRGIYGI